MKLGWTKRVFDGEVSVKEFLIVRGVSPHELRVSEAGTAFCECGGYSIDFPSPISTRDAKIVADAHKRHVAGAAK